MHNFKLRFEKQNHEHFFYEKKSNVTYALIKITNLFIFPFGERVKKWCGELAPILFSLFLVAFSYVDLEFSFYLRHLNSV